MPWSSSFGSWQACFLPLSDASSFVVLYIATSVYFSGVMVSTSNTPPPPTFLHLLRFSFMVIIDFWFALQVRLMLVLAPAACITSGIALSAAFEVFTRSIKFQLPELSGSSQIDVIVLSSLFICNNLLTVW